MRIELTAITIAVNIHLFATVK